MKVAIVILNYNSEEDTIKYVESIKEYKNLNKIIVVDNKSTNENAMAKLKILENEKVEVIQSDKNGGYSYGNNYALRYLDNKNEKKIFMLLQRLKEQFNINIILLSNDQNTLHKYTDNMIFIKNNNVILEGQTNEVYQRVDFLKKKQ